MTTPQTPETAPAYKRYLRNYLLDARFQLKFASYIVGITLVVGALLFAFLWRTTNSLFRQVDGAVQARSKAAETSRELGMCTLNNEVMKNIDDPAFTEVMTTKSAAIDQAYDAERQSVVAAKAALEKDQRFTLFALVGAFGAFIVFITLGAIVTTHRIVGPIFRIKRMATEVAQGKLRPPSYGLRPGDELKDVFEAFEAMVRKLRETSETEAKALTATLEKLKAGSPDVARRELETMLQELEARLAR